MRYNEVFVFLIALLVLSVAWFIPAGLIANTARLKGRTWSSFYLFGLLLSPLGTALIVAVMVRVRHISEIIPCGECRERIGRDAKVCPHCKKERLSSNEWLDRQTLDRVKHQRYLQRTAIVSGAAMLVFVVINAWLPLSLDSENYSSAKDFAEATLQLVRLKLGISIFVGLTSLVFLLTSGAWISREMGYPTLRPDISGEPFYSTKVRSNNE
jgi:hypothetical protein